MTLFDRCIEIVLKNEGGYQCDPNDIGNWTNSTDFYICKDSNFDPELVEKYKKSEILKGTKYGIAARYFPDLDIKNLTKDDARAIYHLKWWRRMNLARICNEELVLHILDHGINSNKRIAIRMIQRIVEVDPDGVIGNITTGAINNWKPYTKVIEGYGLLNGIIEHYKYARHLHYADQVRKYPYKRKYLKGWLNRIEKCKFE